MGRVTSSGNTVTATFVVRLLQLVDGTFNSQYELYAELNSCL